MAHTQNAEKSHKEFESMAPEFEDTFFGQKLFSFGGQFREF